MESNADRPTLQGNRPACAPGNPLSPRRDILRVADVMTKEVVAVGLDDTILFAGKTMSEHGVSCVVVVDQAQAVGILTEKDMLNSVSGRDANFYRLRVRERMSRPVDTISSDVSIFEADKAMTAKGVRRLPVVENGQLVGIVTRTDITRGMISLNPLRYVSDIMTKRVVSVPAESTTFEAARLMSSRNISCLIVRHGEETAGIVTEKDLFKRVVALHRDPVRTLVADVMSLPVVTVPPSCSVLNASKKIETMHFHRLLVVDGKTVCGIITQTDIMRAVRHAFDEMESQQRDLTMELADLVQHTIRDLQRVRNFLDTIPDRRAPGNARTDSTAFIAERPFRAPSGQCDG